MLLNSTDLPFIQFKKLDRIIRKPLSVHKNTLRLILSDRMGNDPLKNIKFDENGNFVSDLDLTDKQKNEIVTRYKDGESTHKIAEDYAFSKKVVRRVLREEECQIRSRKIEFADEQIEGMVMMYSYGFSSQEIAEWFGVCRDTVLRVIKEVGCEIRPPAHLREEMKFKRGNVPWNYVERDIPEPWTDEDAAYVFGVLIGDGCIAFRDESRGNCPKGIRLATPDKEFATEFAKSVESAFEIQVNDHSGNENPYIEALSVDLGKAYNEFKWGKYAWRVPEPFFDASEEIKVALYRGKADSDGTVHGRSLCITSVHKPGLEDMLRVAESFRLDTTIDGPYLDKRPRYRDTYDLKVYECPPRLVRLSRKKKELQKVNG